MRKVINIKPAEEIVLVDPESQREYVGIFNMKSLFLFQTKMAELGITRENLPDCDLMTVCLYSVLNANEEIEYDDVEQLARRIGPVGGKEIIGMFMDMLYDSMSKEQQEMAKKMMAQYVLQARKGK